MVNAGSNPASSTNQQKKGKEKVGNENKSSVVFAIVLVVSIVIATGAIAIAFTDRIGWVDDVEPAKAVVTSGKGGS